MTAAMSKFRAFIILPAPVSEAQHTLDALAGTLAGVNGRYKVAFQSKVSPWEATRRYLRWSAAQTCCGGPPGCNPTHPTAQTCTRRIAVN